LHIFQCACANWLISTSSLKCDITVVFLNPDFLYEIMNMKFWTFWDWSLNKIYIFSVGLGRF